MEGFIVSVGKRGEDSDGGTRSGGVREWSRVT